MKREAIYEAAVCIMIGLVLFYAAAFTYLNGGQKLAFHLLGQDVYEVSPDVMYGDTLDGDHYESYYPVDLKHNTVNYLELITDDGLRGEAVASFYGGDIVDGLFVPEYSAASQKLKGGSNIIKIDESDYPYFCVMVDGAPDRIIRDIRFRESVPRTLTEKNAAVMAMLFIIIAACSLIMYKTLRQRAVKTGHSSNTGTITFLRNAGGSIPQLALGAGSTVSTVLFFAVIANSMLIAMHVGGKKYIPDFHEYLLLQLGVITVLAVIAALFNGSSEAVRTDKPAICVCACLAAYTLASDILIDKPFRFAGTGLFIVLLMLGCVWNSRDRKDLLIRNYEQAVQVFLLMLLILSVCIKDNFPDGRLAGPIKNPSIFALYLGGIWAVLLGSLENHITNKNKRKAGQLLLTVVEMAVTFMLALMSQSLTPLIAMACATMLLIFRALSRNKGLRHAVRFVLVTVLAGLAAFTLLLLYVRNNDLDGSSRLIYKFQSARLSTFLSARDYYWRAYLRKMNLFGHGQKLYVWGGKVNPHNAIIGMAYMYGVPCVIPYILMFMMAIEKSYRYANRYTPYAAVPLYSIVTFVIMGIADNVEQPLVWLPTISCYLLMAPILLMPVEEIEKVGEGGSEALIDSSEINSAEVQTNDL